MLVVVCPKSNLQIRYDTKRKFSELCAERNYRELLEWGLDNGCYLTSRTCALAARHGHSDLLRFLKEQKKCYWTCDTTIGAAAGGHMSILEYVLDQGCDWSKDVPAKAARFGHFDILQWLYNSGYPIDFQEVAKKAMRGGHIEIVEWAREHSQCPTDEYEFEGAVRSGSLAQVKLLAKKVYPDVLNLSMMHKAVGWAEEKGFSEILKWLNKRGGKGSYLCCAVASKNLESVRQVLEEFGEVIDDTVYAMALGEGDLDLVKFFCEEQKIEVPVFACTKAAISKNTELLKWVWERNPNLDAQTFKYAAESGSMEMIKWLKEKNCEWNIMTTVAAAAHGDFEILRWCVKNGCPVSVSAVLAAAKFGESRIINWLIEECHVSLTPQDIDTAVDLAIKSGCLEVIKWFVKNNLYSVQFVHILNSLDSSFGLFKWLLKHASELDDYFKDRAVNYAGEICDYPAAQNWLAKWTSTG